jgi:hypothetical protein
MEKYLNPDLATQDLIREYPKLSDQEIVEMCMNIAYFPLTSDEWLDIVQKSRIGISINP